MLHYLSIVAVIVPFNTFMNYVVVNNKELLRNEIISTHMRYVAAGRSQNGVTDRKHTENDKFNFHESTQYISNADCHINLTHNVEASGISYPVASGLLRTAKNYRQLIILRTNKSTGYKWFVHSQLYGDRALYVSAWPSITDTLDFDNPYYMASHSSKYYLIKVGTFSNQSIMDMLSDSRFVIEKCTVDKSGSVIIQFKVVKDDKVEKELGKVFYESGTVTLDSRRYWVVQQADFIYNKRHWKEVCKYEVNSKGFPLLRSIDERTCDSTPENGLKAIMEEHQSTFVIPDVLPPDSEFTLTRFGLPEFLPDAMVPIVSEVSNPKQTPRMPRDYFLKPQDGFLQPGIILIIAGCLVLVISGLLIRYRSRGQPSRPGAPITEK